jgi:hypothetical protein
MVMEWSYGKYIGKDLNISELDKNADDVKRTITGGLHERKMKFV